MMLYANSSFWMLFQFWGMPAMRMTRLSCVRRMDDDTLRMLSLFLKINDYELLIWTIVLFSLLLILSYKSTSHKKDKNTKYHTSI